MDAETKQYLTEKVLGERWHVPEWICAYCGSPNKDFSLPLEENRTFSTRDDVMDLYEAVAEAKLLPAFGRWLKSKRKYQYEVFYRNDDANVVSIDIDSELEWLFCLSGEGYEDRCQMVAEFWRATESSADSAGRREG